MSLLPRKLGRDLVILKDGVKVAAVRNRTITVNNQPVSLTGDDDNGFNTLLARPGTKQISLDISGVTSNKIFVDDLLSGELSDAYSIRVLDDTGSTVYEINSSFVLTRWKDNGSFNGAIEFQTELLSTGAFTLSPIPGDDGTITVSDIGVSTLTLTWTRASSGLTPVAELEYQVYQSTSNNIATLEAAEANGTIIKSWTADLTTFDVTGLTTGETYYFNVIVRNNTGEKAAYESVSAVLIHGIQMMVFNGNTRVERAANLSGAADNKLMLFSAHLLVDDITKPNEKFLHAYNNKFQFLRQYASGANRFVLQMRNSANIVIFQAYVDGIFSNGVPVHIAVSIDLSSASKRHFFVDGVDQAGSVTWHTYSNQAIDWSGDPSNPGVAVGAERGAGSPVFVEGQMGQYYLTNEYLDLSIPANLDKVYDVSAGAAVPMGADGSDVTGTAPLMFFNDTDPDDWQLNLGSGGDFAQFGDGLTAGTIISYA